MGNRQSRLGDTQNKKLKLKTIKPYFGKFHTVSISIDRPYIHIFFFIHIWSWHFYMFSTLRFRLSMLSWNAYEAVRSCHIGLSPATLITCVKTGNLSHVNWHKYSVLYGNETTWHYTSTDGKDRILIWWLRFMTEYMNFVRA